MDLLASRTKVNAHSQTPSLQFITFSLGAAALLEKSRQTRLSVCRWPDTIFSTPVLRPTKYSIPYNYWSLCLIILSQKLLIGMDNRSAFWPSFTGNTFLRPTTLCIRMSIHQYPPSTLVTKVHHSQPGSRWGCSTQDSCHWSHRQKWANIPKYRSLTFLCREHAFGYS